MPVGKQREIITGNIRMKWGISHQIWREEAAGRYKCRRHISMKNEKNELKSNEKKRTSCPAKKVDYKKNPEYDVDYFNRMYDIWKLARDMGDQVLAKKQINMIYAYCEKYIYKTLWDRYPSMMNNLEHRKNLIQEVWIKIMEELPNYDYTKASITTFIALWIPHVCTAYYSETFSRTSNYFMDAITKVSAAQNILQLNCVESTVDAIVKITKLPEITVTQALDLQLRKDSVSYESLQDTGFEQPSSLMSPETVVLRNEATDVFNTFLEKELNEEEINVLRCLISPKNAQRKTVIKERASYGEIAACLNEELVKKDKNAKAKYNVPNVKRILSLITAKIYSSKPMYSYFSAILDEYKKSDWIGSMPIVDDDEFIKEQGAALSELIK